MSMRIKARPQVTRFLVPEKNHVSQKLCITRLFKTKKIHVSARLLVIICISQVFLDPIQNPVTARSAYLDAAYLEALL